jgi:hypothetical protein
MQVKFDTNFPLKNHTNGTCRPRSRVNSGLHAESPGTNLLENPLDSSQILKLDFNIVGSGASPDFCMQGCQPRINDQIS